MHRVILIMVAIFYLDFVLSKVNGKLRTDHWKTHTRGRLFRVPYEEESSKPNEATKDVATSVKCCRCVSDRLQGKCLIDVEQLKKKKHWYSVKPTGETCRSICNEKGFQFAEKLIGTCTSTRLSDYCTFHKFGVNSMITNPMLGVELETRIPLLNLFVAPVNTQFTKCNHILPHFANIKLDKSSSRMIQLHSDIGRILKPMPLNGEEKLRYQNQVEECGMNEVVHSTSSARFFSKHRPLILYNVLNWLSKTSYGLLYKQMATSNENSDWASKILEVVSQPDEIRNLIERPQWLSHMEQLVEKYYHNYNNGLFQVLKVTKFLNGYHYVSSYNFPGCDLFLDSKYYKNTVLPQVTFGIPLFKVELLFRLLANNAKPNGSKSSEMHISFLRNHWGNVNVEHATKVLQILNSFCDEPDAAQQRHIHTIEVRNLWTGKMCNTQSRNAANKVTTDVNSFRGLLVLIISLNNPTYTSGIAKNRIGTFLHKTSLASLQMSLSSQWKEILDIEDVRKDIARAIFFASPHKRMPIANEDNSDHQMNGSTVNWMEMGLTVFIKQICGILSGQYDKITGGEQVRGPNCNKDEVDYIDIEIESGIENIVDSQPNTIDCFPMASDYKSKLEDYKSSKNVYTATRTGAFLNEYSFQMNGFYNANGEALVVIENREPMNIIYNKKDDCFSAGNKVETHGLLIDSKAKNLEVFVYSHAVWVNKVLSNNAENGIKYCLKYLHSENEEVQDDAMENNNVKARKSNSIRSSILKGIEANEIN